MNQINFPLLSVITFLPLAGAIILLLLPTERVQKIWALAVSLVTFVVSCLLFVWWQAGEAGSLPRCPPTGVPRVAFVLERESAAGRCLQSG